MTLLIVTLDIVANVVGYRCVTEHRPVMLLSPSQVPSFLEFHVIEVNPAEPTNCSSFSPVADSEYRLNDVRNVQIFFSNLELHVFINIILNVDPSAELMPLPRLISKVGSTD